MSPESFEDALQSEEPRRKVWKRVQYSETRLRRKRTVKQIAWVFVALGLGFVVYNLNKIFSDPRWIEPPAVLPSPLEKAAESDP